MDMNNKLKEDALKQLKKLQQAMKVKVIVENLHKGSGLFGTDPVRNYLLVTGHVGGSQIRPCEVVVVSYHVPLLLYWSPVLGLALGLSKYCSGFILGGAKLVQGLNCVEHKK
jgi:hypothetical protein